MREILFRAKPCYRGGEITPWVYGTFRHLWGRRITPEDTDNGRFEKRQDKGCINGRLDLESEVLCDTLGEFTGCYDKKHNRIFEGDILHVFEIREDYQTKELKESDWYTDVVWEQDCTCFLVCDGRDMEQRITQVIEPHHVEQGYCDPFTDFGQKGRPAWEYEVVGNIYNDEDFRKYAQNVLYISEYNKYKESL